MSWVVILWSMDAAFCFTLAGIYLVVWFKQRQEWVHLLFACSAVAAGLIAGLELALMHAETTAQYGALLRLEHLPQWILVVSVTWFVRLYLRAGRWWLVWTICGLRTLELVLNFLFFKPNLNYREITSLRSLPWWGGETVSVAVGVPNPWILIGMLSVLLILIFMVDATITVWRRGDRRRALMVGGSGISFITLSLGISALVLSGVIRSPFFISFPFLGMIAAMGYELSDNVLRAAQLARQFQASEAALRESEVRFRTIADSAPVLIWMSGTDKLCTFFNKPWLEFTGRTMEQEMGNGWAEGVHPDDLQRCLKTYVEAFDARQPFVMQYRLRRHDGEYRWIKDDGVPRYDAQKNFTGYTGSCADVTESINKEQARKESEAEALRHREEVSHLSRVAAMGELTASIAHELNQPLSGITINASTGQRLLDRGDGHLGELRHVLSDIAADARRAGDVIHGIQNMVKKGSSARERLNLNNLVTDTVRMVIPNAMLHSCELEILLEPDLPDIKADPVQMQQVLLNLVINALDATQDAPVGRRKVVIATERTLTGAIRTSVRDYGNGIPEEVRARVFEQFFTTKAKGLGMGLAIVQTIIKSHGGSIVAENADDGGARFYFTLPTTDGRTS